MLGSMFQFVLDSASRFNTVPITFTWEGIISEVHTSALIKAQTKDHRIFHVELPNDIGNCILTWPISTGKWTISCDGAGIAAGSKYTNMSAGGRDNFGKLVRVRFQ